MRIIMTLLKLTLATSGSNYCQVDSVEAGTAVVVCDGGSVVHVPSAMVGVEGTEYGTVWTAKIGPREGGSLETIKL